MDQYKKQHIDTITRWLKLHKINHSVKHQEKTILHIEGENNNLGPLLVCIISIIINWRIIDRKFWMEWWVILHTNKHIKDEREDQPDVCPQEIRSSIKAWPIPPRTRATAFRSKRILGTQATYTHETCTAWTSTEKKSGNRQPHTWWPFILLDPKIHNQPSSGKRYPDSK